MAVTRSMINKNDIVINGLEISIQDIYITKIKLRINNNSIVFNNFGISCLK